MVTKKNYYLIFKMDFDLLQNLFEEDILMDYTENPVFLNTIQDIPQNNIEDFDLNNPIAIQDVIEDIDLNKPIDILSWDEVWGETKPVPNLHIEDLSKEVVPQSDHINEQEFDALNDFNWFIPEWYNKLNRVEEYPGEELKNETFFMYGGGNPWYTLLSTSEREQSKFKIKIKSYNLIAKEMPSENFVQASQACVEFIKQIFIDRPN